MGALEDKRRNVMAGLASGIRNSTPRPDSVLGNQIVDINVLIDEAGTNASGANELALAALSRVKVNVAAATKRYEEDKRPEKSSFEKQLVGNLRDDLLLVLELAETKTAGPIEADV